MFFQFLIFSVVLFSGAKLVIVFNLTKLLTIKLDFNPSNHHYFIKKVDKGVTDLLSLHTVFIGCQ